MRLAVRTCPPRRANLVEYEQPDCRGQIALLANAVDLRYHLGKRNLAHAQFLLDRPPELIFETDAGLVPIKNDGSFDYSRFHERLLWIGTSYL